MHDILSNIIMYKRVFNTYTFIVLLLVFILIILDLMSFAEINYIKYIFVIPFILLFIAKDYKLNYEFKSLQHVKKKIGDLNDITEALRSTMDLDSVLQLILRSLTKEIGFDRAFIFLLETENFKEVLKGTIGIGVPVELLHAFNFPISNPPFYVIDKTVLEKRPFIIRDAKKDPSCNKTMVELLDLEEFATVPLEAHDKVLGVLVVDRTDKENPAYRHISDEEISLLSIFANQAAIAILNAKMYEKINMLSVTDGLTGLYNHRYFHEQLDKELKRAGRLGSKFALVFLDIDYFKNYNDINGHLAGDNLLKVLSEIINSSVRDYDVAARYGGEEFIIILPGDSMDEAFSFAEKLRKQVQHYKFANEEKQPGGDLTISLGVSVYPDDGKTASALIMAADKGMYKSKKIGKNKVSHIKKL